MSQSPPGPNDGWKIPTAADRCSACEAELPPGASVTVVLVLDSEGPSRRDLCERCETPDPAGGIFWRRRIPDRSDGKPVVDYAMLREVFSRLIEREEEAYRRLSYLVALVLVRKRHLRLLGFEARGGKEVMRVSRGAGEEPVEVPAPYLSAEDMVETRDMLTRLLAADLPEDGMLPEPRARPAHDADTDTDTTDADAREASDEPAGSAGAVDASDGGAGDESDEADGQPAEGQAERAS